LRGRAQIPPTALASTGEAKENACKKENIMSEQKETLKEVKQCKHSVRFDNPSKEPKVLSSVYLLKPAYEALGNPTEIEAEIKGVKS